MINIDAFSQPKKLIKALKKVECKEDFICVINHMNATQEVLEKAIDRINDLGNPYYIPYAEVLSIIVGNNLIPPDLLIKAINSTASKDVITLAINHINATEEVCIKAMDQIARYAPSDLPEYIDVLEAVIKSAKVTPTLLIEAIKRAGTSGIIKEAVISPVANELVLSKAVDKVLSISGNAEVIEEVIKSNIVTPGVLIKIIEYAINSSVIIKVIESPMADDTVYAAALKAASHFNSSEQKDIIDALNKKGVTTVNNPNVVIPPAQIPTAPTQSTPTANNNNLNNNVDAQEQTIIENLKFVVETEDNVTSRLRRNVEDGMSSMLWGLSGIGKTARVEEVDPNYTMLKLKNDMLPEEVTGGKEPNGEPGAVYPPYWYVKLCKKCEEEPDKMHILFIDELTNVKNNVKSLVWDIIEDRRVNGNEDWQLPENCAIVAAGNRPEESTAVITDYNGGVLPEPLHDRFDFHIEIPLDMNEWQKWALETNPKTGNLNIHPVVLSFCVANVQKVMFTSLKADDVTQPRLSPRRWEKLSKAIYMAEKRGGKACHVSNQRITECIGTDVASAFIAYYEKQPINMEKVEKGMYKPEDFQNIDDKLYALGLLIAEYKGSEMAVIDFIETCLGDDYVSIYNVMKKQQNEITKPIEKEDKEEKQTVKK